MTINPKLTSKTASKISPLQSNSNSNLLGSSPIGKLRGTIGEVRAIILFHLNNELPTNLKDGSDKDKNNPELIDPEYVDYLKWQKNNMSPEDLAKIQAIKNNIIRQT